MAWNHREVELRSASGICEQPKVGRHFPTKTFVAKQFSALDPPLIFNMPVYPALSG
jgi:hypothetical protein